MQSVCSVCGGTIAFPESALGGSVLCPCGAVIDVIGPEPAYNYTPAEAAAAQHAAASARRSGRRERDARDARPHAYGARSSKQAEAARGYRPSPSASRRNAPPELQRSPSGRGGAGVERSPSSRPRRPNLPDPKTVARPAPARSSRLPPVPRGPLPPRRLAPIGPPPPVAGPTRSPSSRKPTRTDTLASLTDATLDLYKAWLYKQSPKTGKWSKLWVELYDDGLHCFARRPRDGGKRKGVVSFDDESVEGIDAYGLQADGRHKFVVRTSSRQYAFAAEAADEYTIWVELLGEDHPVTHHNDAVHDDDSDDDF